MHIRDYRRRDLVRIRLAKLRVQMQKSSLREDVRAFFNFCGNTPELRTRPESQCRLARQSLRVAMLSWRIRSGST